MSNSAVTTIAEPDSIAPRGFPSWLPPMLVKELRQGIRTPGFVGAFLVFQVLMVLLVVASIVAVPSAKPADRAAAVTSIDSFFWALLALLLLLFTPARALVGLRGEIDSRTLELLVLTRLTAWRIVLGKWASLVAQAALMLVAMLPYGIIRYFGGSVDLGRDAKECLLMLGGCAVLTAVGLWASVLSRIAVAAAILLVAGNQAAGGISIMGVTPIPVVPLGSVYGLVTNNPGPVLLGGLVVMLFSLVATVRRIAPAAENYAPLARSLAGMALLPVPLFAWAGMREAARYQWEFAAGFLLVVCAVELSSNRAPMAAHWRGFARFGPPGRVLGILGLPGWPSALVFSAFMTLVVLALIRIPVGGVSLLGAADPGRASWLAVLIFGSLVLPAVVLSFLRDSSQPSGRIYLLVLVVMSVLAALSAALEATVPFYAEHQLGRAVAVLPISGFWHTLLKDDLGPQAFLVQAALLAATLAVAVWQSRPFWSALGAIAARTGRG